MSRLSDAAAEPAWLWVENERFCSGPVLSRILNGVWKYKQMQPLVPRELASDRCQSIALLEVDGPQGSS